MLFMYLWNYYGLLFKMKNLEPHKVDLSMSLQKFGIPKLFADIITESVDKIKDKLSVGQ